MYQPEYYAFDVVVLEVSDEFPRRITALTIIGKSMVGGYHEDEIFSWTDKKPRQMPKEEPKITKEQLEIISKTYVGENLSKLLFFNGITAIEDLPMAKASELISKLKRE